MEDENYNLLLQKLQDQDAKIEAIEKRCKDLIALNEALYNTKDEPTSINKANRHDELKKKLKGGMRYGL